MKKFKPIFTAVLALALLLAEMPAAVFAAEAPTETSLSVDDAFSSGRFVQMPREEYITGKASLLGIWYSEAEAIVDKSIADAIAELPKEATSETGDNAISPQSWRSTDTETNNNGTFTIYGFIENYYTHSSVYKVFYSVQAIAIASHYGKTWSEVESTGSAYASGNGPHEFVGQCTGRMISTTKAQLNLVGCIQIPRNIALSLGIQGQFTSGSVTIGTTTYLRADVRDTHNEFSM